jgi:BirA family biotin operon repressor/biotin-[acetyl-CoA-carboxylase] ligase
MQQTRESILEAIAEEPATGPALAERLDVSRAAVWKHVEALRGAGFEIDSIGDGYQLVSTPEFGGAAVEFGLEAPFSLVYHESVESTNDRARALAADGATDVVVLADRQTGGRGRLDRSWASPSGGIWLSILLRPDVPPAEAPRFTLAAAVAVAEAARTAGVQAGIKWPNDVLVGGDQAGPERKLAGVLTEMEGEADRVSWLVVGVGVNANVAPESLPTAAATSLSAELGQEIERFAFTQQVLERFHALRTDPDRIVPAWRDLTLTLGREVRVETPAETVEGRAVDVRRTGALVVETDDERVTVTAGDCEHLRPAGSESG